MICCITHSVLLICARKWNSRSRAAFQFVEHYERRYGMLIAWAEELGHDHIVRFLTTNLNEAKAANTVLMARR
ncbi:ferritin-like metal-binding protein YciE [Bradyrhizobium sp. LM3.4]